MRFPKQIILVVFALVLTRTATAAPAYHELCEQEMNEREKSFTELRKCMEKNFGHNDLTEACLPAYETAIAKFRSAKFCELKIK